MNSYIMSFNESFHFCPHLWWRRLLMSSFILLTVLFISVSSFISTFILLYFIISRFVKSNTEVAYFQFVFNNKRI